VVVGTIHAKGAMIPFDGYQPNIYAVDAPHRLPGRHASQFARTMRPREVIVALVLCPIWESRARPFGIAAPRASHAFCLTGERLLISRDYHPHGVAPVTLAIDRDAVVGVEFGQAMIMSWLALSWRDGQAIAQEAFYFPQQGNHLFAALVRELRSRWAVAPVLPGCVLLPEAVFASAGYFHARLLRAVVGPQECYLRYNRRPPLWGTRASWFGRWPVGVAPPATLLLTDRAFICVSDETPQRKGARVFGLNVLCVSRGALAQVAIDRVTLAGVACARLAVAIGETGERVVEVLLPIENAALADEWAQALQAGGIGCGAKAFSSGRGSPAL
jgi:hypothetical protein